jgi:hypothetical protein
MAAMVMAMKLPGCGNVSVSHTTKGFERHAHYGAFQHVGQNRVPVYDPDLLHGFLNKI